MSESPNFPKFELTITDIAPDGRGIGYHESRAVYVPYTIPGEVLTVQVIEDRGDSLLAKGVAFLEPSADRRLPRCVHFGPGDCAGCQWQHIHYEAQLALKTDILAGYLERVAGFKQPPVQLALGSPSEWYYATQATFLPAAGDDLGFPGSEGDSVVPILECHIVQPDVMALRDELDLALPTLKSLEIHTNAAGERMIVMQTIDDEPPELETMFPASLNFLLSHHEPFNMIGATHIQQQIFDRIFRITAGVPYRANIPQVEHLIETVINYLNPQAKHSVLDLYGGIGTFSAFIAPAVRQIIYIDSYPPAATDAEANLADFNNIDILEGRADIVLSEIVAAKPRPRFDAAIVDPPSQGLNRGVLEGLHGLAVPTLLYVAQNPATFARDAKTLVQELGYRLIEVQPIDFAPQTAAIECVALFRRK